VSENGSSNELGALDSQKPNNLILKALQSSPFRVGIGRSDDAIFLTDIHGLIQYINPAFERLYGFTPEEAIGRTPALIQMDLQVQCDDSEIIKKQFANEAIAGISVTTVKDGRRLTVESIQAPIIDIEGEPIGFMVSQRDITAQGLFDEALHESENRFSMIFETGPFPMVLSNRSLKFIRANDAFCKMMGYSEREVIELSVKDITHPDYIMSDLDGVGKVQRGELPLYKTGKRYIRKDGRVIWGRVTLGRVCDNNGQFLYILAMVEDITERKEAEEALILSKSHLETALASMTDAVFISDVDGRFIEFNEAFATFHKFKNKQECAKTLQEYPEILEVYSTEGKLLPIDRWAVPRALGGETNTNAEFTLRRKDTGETWIGSYSFGPIRDNNGSIIGSVVVSRDITDQKRAQEELHESEMRRDLALDAAQMGTWDWNLITGKLSWFSAHGTLWGFAPGTFPGTFEAFAEHIHPDDLVEMHRIGEIAKKSQSPFQFEYRLIGPDGSMHWVASHGRYLYNSKGTAIRLMGVIFDITERKKADEALESSEYRLRSTMDNMLEGCQIIDKDWQLIYINSAAEMHNKRPNSALIGKNYKDIWPGIENTRVFELIKQCLEQGIPHKIENEFKFPDGTIGQFELSIQPIPEGVFIQTVDITQRKKAEDELKIRNLLLTTQQEAAIDGILAVDDKGHILSYNKKFIDLWEISPEIVAAKFDGPVLKIVTDKTADPKSFIDRVSYLYNHPEETGRDELQLKDGRTFDRYSSPMKAEDGTYYGRVWFFRDITPRKLAEQAIRESESKYRQLHESMMDAFACSSLDGRMTEYNQAYLDLLGYTKDEITGLTYQDITPEKWHELDEKIVRDQILPRGYSDIYEKEFRRKDGSVVPVELRVVLLKDKAENPSAMWALVRDISERKRSELALKSSEERFRTVANYTYDWEYWIAPDGRFVYCSPSCESLTGYTPDEFVANPNLLTRIVHVDDLEVLQQHTREPGNKTCNLDFRIIARNGQIRWIGHVCTPVFSDVGKYLGHRASNRDITNSKNAEKAMQRLVTAVEQAAEGIVITDLQGNMQYVNPAFCRMTGYLPEEVTGKNTRLLKSGKQDRNLYKNLWKTINNGGIWTGKLVNRKKDGTFYTEEITISPIIDGSGQITNFVALKKDVSQELALENQLLHAQKMEAVGRLAGGVAHDFNNLTTVMMGYSEILLESLDGNENLQADVQEIKKATERASSLTRQLLAFSRKQIIQPQVLSLNIIVSEMSKMLKRLIGEDIELILEAGNGLWPIKADPGQIEQIIVNLVVNARDAMPKGGKLAIKTSNISRSELADTIKVTIGESDSIMLEVTDNGDGISDDIKAHIFEPFFTTKELGKGTGLGLATVYGIVEQNGGAIEVDSKQGIGTTFRIYWPKLERLSQAVPNRDKPVNAVGGIETILIVEDETSVRELIRRMLEELGYKTITAENPQHAIDICGQFGDKINMLLTDVVMPEMNGEELSREVRKLIPNTPVLFISGYTDSKFIKYETLESLGGFLQKPFNKESLAQKIRAQLEKKTGQAPIFSV
jgi:two-component system, cell cycle sensor histidine kinase and response regulator CckA